MGRKQILYFFAAAVGIVVLNIFAYLFPFRLDLTEDQRFSISPATQKMLKNLDDDVIIKVYLEGDFPGGFKRLQKSIRETLEEFKIYSSGKIKFRFIDPSAAKTEADKKKLFTELYQKGILPTNINAKEGDKKVEKIIFPGAILNYKNMEISALLFKTGDQRMQGAPSPDQILNQSIENVEYNLASAIKQLTISDKNKKNVGILEGHGELDNLEMADLLESLSKTYNVYKVDLIKESNLEGLDAVIVAKPDSTFKEEDKYKIDQYVVKGGKTLFFIDAVGIYMDSVLRDKGSFSFPLTHNLGDMLFKYGIRLNTDIIKDLNAGFIPLVIGNMGDQKQIRPIPWTYYPIINTFAKHPIVKNLDAVYTKFVGTLDTVKADGIKKTALLFSSNYTQLVSTPYFVTFDEARVAPDPKNYNKGSKPVAFLLEGKFTSMYKNRIVDSDPRSATFQANGVPTKILVCADGDLLKNDVDPKTKNPLPMGFEPMPGNNGKFERRLFSNKDFVLNALDYLLDENGIMSARRKEIVLRPLDKIVIKEQRSIIQELNFLLPILLVFYFALIRFYHRTLTYAQFSNKTQFVFSLLLPYVFAFVFLFGFFNLIDFQFRIRNYIVNDYLLVILMVLVLFVVNQSIDFWQKRASIFLSFKNIPLK